MDTLNVTHFLPICSGLIDEIDVMWRRAIVLIIYGINGGGATWMYKTANISSRPSKRIYTVMSSRFSWISRIEDYGLGLGIPIDLISIIGVLFTLDGVDDSAHASWSYRMSSIRE